MDGMGWDLCAGLFYEHRFAMLITLYACYCIVWYISSKKISNCSQVSIKVGEGESKVITRLVGLQLEDR